MITRRHLHRVLARAALSTVGLGLLSSNAWSHPIHAALAEVEHNPKTGRLEVAMRVAIHDLERALSDRAGRPVPFEGPGVEAQITAWLREIFEVRRSGGAPLKMRWVGREAGPLRAWLYFEVEAPGDPAGLSLTWRAFFDTAPTQLNTLHVLKAGRVIRSLAFTRAAPTQPWPSTPEKAPPAP